MIKGCQKKIIVVRDTRSDVFEEAYFIVRDNSEAGELCETDMVAEANRLLSSESICGNGFPEKTERSRRALPSPAYSALRWYLFGMASAGFVFSVIMLFS